MTRICKRMIGWLLGAVTLLMLVLGIAFTRPQIKTVSADTVTTAWASFYFEPNVDGTTDTRLRFNTTALAWKSSHNGAADDQYLAYTKINGRTVKEINAAAAEHGSSAQITANIQPAGTFSFYSLIIPQAFTEISMSDIYSVSIEAGWTYTDNGTGNTYTTTGVRFDLMGTTWRQVTEFVNLDSGDMKFSNQGALYSGVNCFLIRFGAQAKIANYMCFNDNYQKTSPLTSLTYGENLDYITINGKTIGQIKAENPNYDYSTSAHPNIKNGGSYAPIFAHMSSADLGGGVENYIQIFIPTDLIDPSTVKEISLKPRLFNYVGTTKYGITEEITFVNKNGSWVDMRDLVNSNNATISDVRVDGTAGELYKVDITSSLWNSTCDSFDYNYVGYVSLRQNLFINGVSVHTINTTVDDSVYIYSTSPMTNTGTYKYGGKTYDLFANPVLLQGAGDTMTLWIHKDYINSLKGNVTLTVGENFNYLGTGMSEALSKVLIEYEVPTYTVTVDGVPQTVTEGALAVEPATPTKEEDENYTYTFDNWYIKDTDTVFDFSTPIGQDYNVESRFTKHAKDTSVQVNFDKAVLDKETHATYGTSIRFNTEGLQWNTSHNWVSAADWASIADYTFINGKSITEINAEITEGQKLTLMMQPAGSFSFLRVYIPETVMSVDDVMTMGIQAGWSFDNGTKKYVVAVTNIFYNNAGSMSAIKEELLSNDVTISSMRIDGVQKELYKVDITSAKWTITANEYDYNYFGAQYKNVRKNIYINGVSVYDINTTVDDSAYVYSTDPMTNTSTDGSTGYDLFANPVLIQSPKGGNTLTLWIHKDYIASLGAGEITVTLGSGLAVIANSGVVLIDEISTVVGATYVVTVENYDGTILDTQLVSKGGYATAIANPTRPMTQTAIYTFAGWKDSEGNDFVFGSTPITGDITVIAQYNEQTVELLDTEVLSIQFQFTSAADNWLIFHLSNHDYTCATGTTDYSVSYEELQRIGFLDNVVLKGDLVLGSTTVQEATLAQLLAANGAGEGRFINFWGEGTLGVRVKNTPAYNSITSISVKAGTYFPSYQYACLGNTAVDVRYMVLSEQAFEPGTATQSDDLKTWTTPFGLASVAGYDIFMADGAAIRITSLESYDGSQNYMETEGYKKSGIRFQTFISKTSIEEIQNALGSLYKAVSFGTLIVPSADILGGQFTHAWLEANSVKHMDIASTAWVNADDYAFAHETDDYVTFFGSIVNFKAANHGRYFSGVGYIKVTKTSGEEVYFYAPYKAASSRSASYIAQAAVADRSETGSDYYANKIEENNNWSPYTEGEITFLKLYMGTLVQTEVAAEAFTLTSTGELASVANSRNVGTLTVNKKLNGAYVQLNYHTDIDVWGKFYYQNNAGTASAVEDFYLQKGTSQHKQYLDLFRKNGVGKLAGLTKDDLYLTKIEFKNATVDKASTGTFKFLGLYSSAKTLDTANLEVYVTKTLDAGGEMTVGAHLGLAGSLTYLAKSGIYEGATATSYKSGSILLRQDTNEFVKERYTNIWRTSKEAGYYGHATSSKPGDGAVNLINNYDAGRQIQQSWYANVGGSLSENTGANGYTRLSCSTGDGGYWPYNPVQAGDCVSNPGQIIDYEVNEEKGYIYVKARAMDWAYGDTSKGGSANGSTTKSYMENYYRLNADGTLYVNNSFIDWNGFTDMGNCDFCLVELPAFYPIQSLNYFFTYDGTSPWTGAGLTRKSDLSAWTSGGNSHYQSRIDGSADGSLGEEWVAWANDASGSVAFGMYIPNVTRFTSGRSQTAVNTGTSTNVNASNNLLKSKGLMSNMQPISYTYQGCYVQNTSYTAPGVSFRMEAYTPIEYTYVLAVNDIDTIRSQFKAIHDSGKVTNAGTKQGEKMGLDAWARDDKVWTQF